MALPRLTFSGVVFVFQVILLICYISCVDYTEYQHPSHASWTGGSPANSSPYYYAFFQDVHVMIFIGFGFLMTFLKKYSHGAVGYNLFIAAVVIQWATLINGWITNAFEGAEKPEKLTVDLKTLITSDFAAAAVLITFGAVLGKVSRLQLFVIGVFEIIFYAVNENILVHHLKITDVGGSMVIHMFGAYFGLAVTRMIYKDDHGDENPKEGSVYHSDLFAMIGTVFLWMFWPSFNAAMLGPGPQQHRAIINTYYSLAACCVATFVISPLVNKHQKLDMVHIQNATLAGGVAVGTCADLIIKPWGAILIGMIGGIISTLGYAYVTPFLNSKLKIHDTCGVNNLHGMPAILAAIAGSITASVSEMDKYGEELFNIWAARTPKRNTTMYDAAIARNIQLSSDGIGRSAKEQGGYQIAAMFVTLLLAVFGGCVTGLFVRFLDTPKSHQLYDDEDFWITEQAEEGNSSANEALLLREKKIDIEEKC